MKMESHRIRDLFVAAIGTVDPAQWDDFLEDVSDGDENLVREVRLLLAAHRDAGSFLEIAASTLTVALESPHIEAPGTVIGPYKLLESIGEGGMGVVYLADQREPVRRSVALKIIKPGMDTRQVIARFEAERQALALMDHPNIARVLDAGTAESGRPYFVMELVRGIPITDFCDKVRLSIPERLDLFVSVCRAVQHAHQRGIIHRDLKPSNVMVTLIDGARVPKVIDFGIAKATGGQFSDRTLFTGLAQLVGTPLYMSPEQAELSGVDVDTRSDIFALGVLLYELLTGTTPIDRDTVCNAAYDEIRRIIREQEPPTPSARLGALGASLRDSSANRQSDLRKLGQVVRGELDWIVMKALEKDRNRRYETANDFAADVTRFLNDQAVEACPQSAWYRVRKYVRRNRMILMTTALVAGALVTGTVVSSWQAFRATIAERRTMAALAVAERNERTNRRFWYGSQIRLIQQEMAAGQIDFAQESLERLRPNPGEPDPRGFEWYHIRRIAHRNLSLLFGHESSVLELAMSPDGRTLASGDTRGGIVFWDLLAWRERARVQGHATGILALACAPDGRLVASSSGDVQPSEVKIWDPATGREVARLPGISRSVRELAFSHDGRTLAVCERSVTPGLTEGRVHLWTISSGPTLAMTELPSIASTLLAVSPDHRILATAAASGEVTLRDASTGRATLALPGPFSYVRGIAFTPRGNSVGVHNDSGITLFDSKTGRAQDRAAFVPEASLSFTFDSNGFAGLPVRRGNGVWLPQSNFSTTLFEDVSERSWTFQFSPDARTLAGTGPGPSATIWDTSTGKRLTNFRRAVGNVHSLAFTPDGKTLIFASGDTRVRAWHLQHPPEPVDHLAGHDKEIWGLAYTPDGKTLASASDDHTIKLWNPRDGALRGTLTGHASLVTSLAVSPDGTTLASGGFDCTVRLWDLPSGRPRAVLSGHTDRVRGVAFSPDGGLLASCSSDFTVRLWDVKGARERATLRGHIDGFHDIAFDPDGTRLISAGNDGFLRVWDLGGNDPPLTIPGPKACTALALSRDGSLLATGSDRGVVVLWDPRAWSNRIALKGSNAAIRKLSFSPDGRTLAAACNDAKVRLWDPITGQLTLVLDGHLDRVNAVVFSPDGSTLSSASHDGAIKLWYGKQP